MVPIDAGDRLDLMEGELGAVLLIMTMRGRELARRGFVFPSGKGSRFSDRLVVLLTLFLICPSLATTTGGLIRCAKYSLCLHRCRAS